MIQAVNFAFHSSIGRSAELRMIGAQDEILFDGRFVVHGKDKGSGSPMVSFVRECGDSLRSVGQHNWSQKQSEALGGRLGHGLVLLRMIDDRNDLHMAPIDLCGSVCARRLCRRGLRLIKTIARSRLVAIIISSCTAVSRFLKIHHSVKERKNG